MTDDTTKSEDYLYLLSWVDCLERLDMLLLEARHLQRSIIHSLRVPPLYLLLASEEARIWGEGWISELDKEYDVAELARKWMQLYPTPAEVVQGRVVPEGEESEDSEILEKLQEALKSAWYGGKWGRDQKRNYHTLGVVQVLKRQILYDKLFLCDAAIKARIAYATGTSELFRKKSRFMLLRMAVLARVRTYVQYLGDHKSAFNRAMDSGPQDHPRPTTERRRELGVYTDFLSDRARDLTRDMHLLLNDLGACSKREQPPVVLHSWAHDFNSHQASLDDEVAEHASRSYHYIKTNFWMPERPDLQPIIAHEIAHGVLVDVFENLTDRGFSVAEDEFSVLLFELRNCLGEFRVPKDLGLPVKVPVDPLYLIREIACDLLAASIKGYTYLYAMFLEIIGYGLESLCDVGENHYNLQLIEIEWPMKGGRGISWLRGWHLRLHLVVAWLEQIHHHDSQCQLDDRLREGTLGVANRLSNELDQMAPEDEKDTGKVWCALRGEMVRLLTQAPVCKYVQDWRQRRCTDDRDENWKKGGREMPRSMRRLDWRVRDFLYRVQIAMKCEDGRPLNNWKGSSVAELDKRFRDTYGVGHVAGEYDPGVAADGDSFNALYRHIYDIPWQCALLRAMDIFLYTDGVREKNNKNENEITQGVMKQLQFDFAQGRELFQLALEFFLRDSDSSHHRLATAIRLVRDLGESNKGVELQGLRKWLGADEDFKYSNSLAKELPELSRADIRLCLLDNPGRYLLGEVDQVERWVSAISISGVFACITSLDAETYRKAECLAGRKLEALLVVIEEAVRDLDGDLRAEIEQLCCFLAIRHVDDDSKGSHQMRFFTLLLKAFGQDFSSDGAPEQALGWKPTEGVVHMETFILGRAALAGSYSNSNEKNSLSLQQVLRYPGWTYDEEGPCRKKKTVFWQTLLGRYDALFLTKTRPLCRCILPWFPSKDSDLSAEGKLTPDLKHSSGRVFPTFFLRQEMAIPLRFGDTKPWDSFNNNSLVAMIAIVLHHRADRLDFIYQLLCGCAAKHDSGDWPSNGGLHSVGKKMKRDKDWAWLTDGWGDLILVFNGEMKRLEEVFSIQDELYNHFMIDRTELILSTDCLDYALSDKGQRQGFDAEVQVRLVEDRLVRNINNVFKNRILDKFDVSEYRSGHARGKIFKIPGHMDFNIPITGIGRGSLGAGGVHDYRSLVNFLVKNNVSADGRPEMEFEYLDRLSTSIKLEQKR